MTLQLRLIILLLQVLVWFQRSLRLIIRAAWMGIAGILLAWISIHHLNVLPQITYLSVILACLILPPLILVLFSWPSRKQFLWKVDQRLELKEQISTAWMVLQREVKTIVAEELVIDASFIAKKVLGKVLFFGWYFWKDLASLILVVGLGWFVIEMDFRKTIDINPINGLPVPLMPLGTDPDATEIFPDGLPILPNLANKELEAADHSANDSPDSSGSLTQITESDINQLNATLHQLGQALSQSTITYEPGQDLKSKDLSRATQALHEISDNMESYSDQLKNQIAESLNEASQGLENTTLEELHNSFANAAIQVKNTIESAESENRESNTSSLLAKEQMDKVASEISRIANQIGNNQQSNTEENDSQGAGAGFASSLRERGDPKPVPRLTGEGEELVLSSLGDQEASILIPKPGNQPGKDFGEGVSSVLDSSFVYRSEDRYTNWITPYNFPWKWRNVVSEYFDK